MSPVDDGCRGTDSNALMAKITWRAWLWSWTRRCGWIGAG